MTSTFGLLVYGLVSCFALTEGLVEGVVRSTGSKGNTETSRVLMQSIANNQGSVSGAEHFVKNLAEKVAFNNYKTTVGEDEALETIKTFLKDTEAHALQKHNDDITALTSNLDEIKACAADEQTFRASGADIITQCDAHDASHDDCRTGEVPLKQKMDTSCAEYDEYRKNKVPQLSEDCITSDMAESKIKGEGDERETMETCLVHSFEWLPTLHELYLKCKKHTDDHNKSKNTCDDHQGQLEECSCQYKSHIDAGCVVYDTCYKRETDEHSTLEDRVKKSADARKQDQIALKKIECYLDVFASEDAAKPAVVSKCKGLEVDTSMFDVVFPDVPDATTCQTPDSPCDGKWTAARYQSKDWHGKVVMAPCGQCPGPTPAPTAAPTPAPTAAPTPAPTTEAERNLNRGFNWEEIKNNILGEPMNVNSAQCQAFCTMNVLCTAWEVCPYEPPGCAGCYLVQGMKPTFYEASGWSAAHRS